MIIASSLEKYFGRTRAVDDISFTVKRGEAVGFLGPNGAGKTTTFRMLAGVLGPTRGSVSIGGHDLAFAPLKAKRLLGYMPENPVLYPEMTSREYLLFRAELKGVSRSQRAKAASAALVDAGAEEVHGVRISHLSKGFRQRVALADALLNDPPALLLDEPTSGLDPNQIGDMRKLIRRLAKDRAVLLSTHVLSEVQATCSRVIVIHRGRLVTEGSLLELTTQKGRRSMVTVEAGTEELKSAFSAAVSAAPAEWNLTQVLDTADDAARSVTFPHQPELVGRVVAYLADNGFCIISAGLVKATLDEVFSELTAQPEGPAA